MGWFDGPMSPRQRQRWARERARGKWTFIMVRGVLQFGLGMAILWPVLMAVMDGEFSSVGTFVQRVMYRGVGAVVLFPVGGVAVGLLSWWSNERRFAARGDK
jgi:hypothetical protein